MKRVKFKVIISLLFSSLHTVTIYRVIFIIVVVMYFVIVVHVLLEKCLEKCQAENNNEIELESNISQELQVTTLTGPGILLPMIFQILFNRILLIGILSSVLSPRWVVMIEDILPNLWICLTPPYYYLKNPHLRKYVWHMLTRKNSIQHQNNDIELDVI